MTQIASADLFSLVRNELRERFLVWDTQRRGAHTAVFVAHDARTGRRVMLHVASRSALVRASGGGSGRSGGEEQFRQAVAAAAALQHPGVVPILATGTSESFEWYAEECVENGTRMASLLDSSGPLVIGVLMPVLQQLADVLTGAHRAGVAHGGLSAANVFVTDEGRAFVSEFGTRRILRMLHQQEEAGASSAAPGGGDASFDHLRQCDRYALALLAQECLTGRTLAALFRTSMDENGADAAVAMGNAYSELQALVDSRPPLSEDVRAQLSRTIGGQGDACIPSVMEIAAVLGSTACVDPDEDVQLGPPHDEGPLGQAVLVDKLLFETPGDPPSERHTHITLLATVLLTAAVTWMVAEVLQRPAVQFAPDTVFVNRFATTPTAPATPPATSADAASPAVTVSGPVTTEPNATLRQPGSRVAEEKATSPVTRSAGNPRPSAATTAPAGGTAVRGPTPPDTTETRAVVLEGQLSISTRPWGYLYVDGVLVGNTPASDIALSVGPHMIRVVRDGYQAFEREITIVRGARLRLIDLILIPQERTP